MTGVAHIALGSDPYLNDKGKYCFKDWTEQRFKWPDEADWRARNPRGPHHCATCT